MPLHERADERFVWNRHLIQEMGSHPELVKFILPIMHGCKLLLSHFELFRILSLKFVYISCFSCSKPQLQYQSHTSYLHTYFEEMLLQSGYKVFYEGCWLRGPSCQLCWNRADCWIPRRKMFFRASMLEFCYLHHRNSTYT